MSPSPVYSDIINIASQFGSMGGTITYDPDGSPVLVNGTLFGDSGTLEVDYDTGSELFGVFFNSPYSWDLISGVGAGTFACGDADGGTTCASVAPQQSDWDYVQVTPHSFVDNGDGTGSINLDAVNARLDTFNWSLAGDVVSAVPAPAALWLFGSGLIGIAGVARRKWGLSAVAC